MLIETYMLNMIITHTVHGFIYSVQETCIFHIGYHIPTNAVCYTLRKHKDNKTRIRITSLIQQVQTYYTYNIVLSKISGQKTL